MAATPVGRVVATMWERRSSEIHFPPLFFCPIAVAEWKVGNKQTNNNYERNDTCLDFGLLFFFIFYGVFFFFVSHCASDDEFRFPLFFVSFELADDVCICFENKNVG